MSSIMSRPPLHGWIGVDLDATLAHYDGWRGGQHIGAPIEPMLTRIRAWLAEGREVRVFTARASDPEQVPPVRAWLDGLGLDAVGVTCVKDFAMVELWDDRVVQVEPNTGRAYGPSRIDGDEGPLLAEIRRLTAIRTYLDAVNTQPAREEYPEWNAIADEDRFRLQAWGDRACQAGMDAAEDADALDESIAACDILGIDRTGDYDYLATLRAVVKERDNAVDAFHRCRQERDEARAELALQQRATNVMIGESYTQALATARIEGAQIGATEAIDTIAPSLRNLPASERESLTSIVDRATKTIRALDPAAVAGGAPVAPSDTTLFTCRCCSASIPGFTDGSVTAPGWCQIDNIDGPNAMCPGCATGGYALAFVGEDYPDVRKGAAMPVRAVAGGAS